ncbi:MAG: CBS domain-containing protein [Myxococcales bacterium]
MGRQPQVCDYMTVAPHSVGLDQSLATAVRRMHEHKLRHLPVLEGGALRGIISERDVALAESFGLDPSQVSVEEAMTAEPYTVTPNAPLGHVARAMAAHKYGCAVVTEGTELRGILTTTDAMRALADTLERQEDSDSDNLPPSQVCELMRTEHTNIRTLLDRADDHAQEVLSGNASDQRDVERGVHALRDAARQLYTCLSAHIELENRVLAPALKQTDAWGPMRADGLLSCHAEQKRALEGALMELDDLTQPATALASHVEALIQSIRDDLDNEEETLLSPELLRDDPIIENAETD